MSRFHPRFRPDTVLKAYVAEVLLLVTVIKVSGRRIPLFFLVPDSSADAGTHSERETPSGGDQSELDAVSLPERLRLRGRFPQLEHHRPLRMFRHLFPG